MLDPAIKTTWKNILEEGLEVLSLSLGIVSKIDGSSYQVLSVMPETSVFKAGESFDVQDTYCREVVEKQDIVALTRLENIPGLSKHPLYSGLPLESYISAPIIVNGDVWGTLNFSSMKIRQQKFSEPEIEFIRGQAEAIAQSMV